MINIFITDYTGRTQLYDEMLFSAIKASYDGDVSLLAPGHGLISLIPKKYQSSLHAFKRIVKIVECFINYLIVGLKVLFSTKCVLHLQWLPFMEISGVEKNILLLYKRLSPQLKIILTVHNVYPHSIKEGEKSRYRNRFIKTSKFIDAFIVHTTTTKNELCSGFKIDSNQIHVCPHGVFTPLIIKSRTQDENSDKLKILMFGVHSYYKGTDILVDAINKLPEDYRKKIDVHVVGLMDSDYFDSLKESDMSQVIEWKNYYLSDEELGNEISWCDLIVLPYRKISQSGVLLMALNCSRMIVCSDVPSFKETLHGSDNDSSYDHELFFKSGDSGALCSLLEKYIMKQVPQNELLKKMDKLAKDYTWEKSAEKTVEVYRRLLC